MKLTNLLRGAFAGLLLAGLLPLAASAAAPPPLPAQRAPKPPAASPAKASRQPAEANAAEDFYIVVSVNQSQKSLVLKLPTEVTTGMAVGDQSVFLDENGKRVGFADLHAGDTVYVTHRHAGSGEDLVVRVRKGPMTVAELHRRYLKFQ